MKIVLSELRVIVRSLLVESKFKTPVELKTGDWILIKDMPEIPNPVRIASVTTSESYSDSDLEDAGFDSSQQSRNGYTFWFDKMQLPDGSIVDIPGHLADSLGKDFGDSEDMYELYNPEKLFN